MKIPTEAEIDMMDDDTAERFRIRLFLQLFIFVGHMKKILKRHMLLNRVAIQRHGKKI